MKLGLVRGVKSVFVGVLALSAWQGCTATGVDPIDDGAGGEEPSTSAGGAGADGGAGGEVASPCGMDCSAISAPQCYVSVCNEGQAAGPVGSCVVVPDEAGLSCDDGQFCTTDDTCDGKGLCVGGGANDCGQTPAECAEIVCNEDTDSCAEAQLVNGTACTPADLCEVGGACQNGLCIGAEKDCFFSPVPNECHVAVCNPNNGECEPIPGNDNASCTLSSDLCSVGNTCSAGVCSGGAPKDCGGLTAGCLEGICDTVTGQCTTQPIPPGGSCTDFQACTSGEICDANGMCGGGAPVTACVAGDGCCPAGCTDLTDIDCACSVADILIEEVSTGDPDYIQLKNYSVCPLNIDALHVFQDDTSSNNQMDLPSFVLQPGASVYLMESGGTTTAPVDTLTLSFSMGWVGGAGAMWLCEGACNASNGSNVVDAVIWETNGGVGLPTGITFSPAPIPTVLTNESVLRVNTQGAPPSLLQSDWTAGPNSI